jgi:hypothetical protein
MVQKNIKSVNETVLIKWMGPILVQRGRELALLEFSNCGKGIGIPALQYLSRVDNARDVLR